MAAMRQLRVSWANKINGTAIMPLTPSPVVANPMPNVRLSLNQLFIAVDTTRSELRLAPIDMITNTDMKDQMEWTNPNNTNPTPNKITPDEIMILGPNLSAK